MTIKKDIRSRLIKAAEREFLRYGFQGARMQAIADAAGTNKALLHYYFQSKEKLYDQVLELQFAALVESLFSLIEGEVDFDVWLQNFIRKSLREVVNKPNFSRFVFMELSSKGAHLPGMVQRLLKSKGRAEHDLLILIRSRLQSVGLDDYDPLQFLLNVLSLCIFPSLAKPIVSQVIGVSDAMNADFIKQREREIYLLLTQGIFRPKES